MGNAIEPKHHGPDQQCHTVLLTGEGGGNSYSTPTWIGHHPSTSCGAWPPTTGACASPPFLRITGRVLASNGDRSRCFLR